MSKLQKAILRRDGVAVTQFIRQDPFETGMKKAYADDRGYHIDNFAGNKTMFVAGTKSFRDHANNFTDLIKILPHRRSKRTRTLLNKVANNNEVDLVVGHSRGAKFVDELTGNFSKLAVDGAMRISKGPKTTMNVRSSGFFDKFIGKGGKSNYENKRMKLRNFHNTYREAPRRVRNHVVKRGPIKRAFHDYGKRGLAKYGKRALGHSLNYIPGGRVTKKIYAKSVKYGRYGKKAVKTAVKATRFIKKSHKAFKKIF